ncbi:MAG: SDR family NAD(P)-dependent oxidoreductase [Actinomycetes bacterium]
MPTALVTGASSGIGRAYAERLAADGYDLVLVARRRERLDELAAALETTHGVAVEPVVVDLAEADAVAALADRLMSSPVDLLVNNAGLAHYMPFTELPAAKARELIDVNVTAPVLLAQAVLPGMVAQGSGAIINVASLLAFSGAATGPMLPQRAVYAATKAFLVAHTQILAGELVDTGVRVQVVCPGVVRSEFHSRQGLDLSAVPRMEPDQVVNASLADLARGVVVSIPGLPDESAVTRYNEAAGALSGVARATELPERYSAGTP